MMRVYLSSFTSESIPWEGTMSTTFRPVGMWILGAGFVFSTHLWAQSPAATGTLGAQNQGSATGTIETSGATNTFIDLRGDRAYSRLMAGHAPEIVQLRDLLNFRIQARDGAFGQVTDVVFDSHGNIQYLLGSFQGRVYPLPLTPAALSWSPKTLR